MSVKLFVLNPESEESAYHSSQIMHNLLQNSARPAIVAANTRIRKWVGIDISPTACKIMVKRLQRQNVKTSIDDIIDLPRRINEIKKMIDLDPIEFQNWVCEKLGAVSTTPKGSGTKSGW
jgi:hypothetical protein